MYQKYIKRMLDIVCALAAMLAFCWLYAIVAILVRVKLGSPVIFRQSRPGRNEKLFHLYKFRTMTDARDETGTLLPDAARLTKFGRFLRAASLDELPEAWNILRGDMSVVGPRPLLTRYLPRYNAHQRRRHEVRPGLSGWAQVNGRNALSWEEKFDLDVWYVDHVGFLLDVKIVCLTVCKAVKREGISGASSATMQEFLGTQDQTEVGVR
ncbi:MAG: sugar transferase [Oscillospiraceae bacterium]|nr:sugar transferase [Oscillospiraceae bacterium]